MNRLAKRVEKLEGGTSTGVDIVAKVPAVWSAQRGEAEVTAIAIASGVNPPFRNMIFLKQFRQSEEDGAEIIFMGKFGVDQNLSTPLTGNMRKDRTNGQA